MTSRVASSPPLIPRSSLFVLLVLLSPLPTLAAYRTLKVDILNSLIARSLSPGSPELGTNMFGTCTYCDGSNTGVVFRQIFDGEEDGDAAIKGVAASLLHQDIVAPSPTYPCGNPQCPAKGFDGYFDNIQCDDTPWYKAVVGVVVGAEGMSKLYTDFADVQDPTWGYGVFYATDSNSCNFRCRFLAADDPDNPFGIDYYNCPDGWTYDFDTGVLQQDFAFGATSGSGTYEVGNQYAGLDGGCSGCHFDTDIGQFNQLDSYQSDDIDSPNLTEDFSCQCNYALKGDETTWEPWVTQLITGYKIDQGGGIDGFLDVNAQGERQKIPSYGLDYAACWVNNPRDVINLQNQIYFQRLEWSNQLQPLSEWEYYVNDPYNQRIYWGWNEIPVDREINDPSFADAIAIRLPTDVCGQGGYNDTVDCLSAPSQIDLECQLTKYVKEGYLYPGADYANLMDASQRPGSDVVFLKSESYDNDNLNQFYESLFYCQAWTSPNGYWKIVYDIPDESLEIDENNPGACYLDYGTNFPGDLSSLPDCYTCE